MNNSLRKKLILMAKKDQQMRKSDKWDAGVDKVNTIKLKNIIKKQGWPDINMVGNNGATAAWLIVQHADHDVKFQKQCLKLMKKKVKKNLIDKKNIAYLTDRIYVNEGKSQLYGTQFYLNKYNKFTYRPIRNIKNLDIRRKKMGLGPFREYYKKMINKNVN